MAGYTPKDLKQKFVAVFVPEEGVDTTRTPLKVATDLALSEGKRAPSKVAIARLEKAMKGHEDAV